MVFSATLAFFTKSVYADEVDIAVAEYPPFAMEQGEQQGVIAQVVKQAFAQSGINVNYHFSGWLEVEEAVDNEKHLSIMWNKSNARERKWLFSKRLYRTKVVVLATKESRIYWDRIDQLRRYDLGLQRGQSYGDEFDNYRQYLNVTESISDYVNLKKLMARTFDGIVVEALEGRYLLSYFPEKQRASVEFIESPIIDSKNNYLVCAKSYSKCFNYINAFNQGLLQLQQTGEYQKIINSLE